MVTQVLTEALDEARAAMTEGILTSTQLSRKNRELLESAGWLRRIIRGWYLLQQPTDERGATTRWYASFWAFSSQYLHKRSEDNYCLSAESSLDLHLGPTRVPEQLVVISARGGNNKVDLPEGNSILTYQMARDIPSKDNVEVINGLRAMTLPQSLARVGPRFFEGRPREAEIALRLLGDPGELIRLLISGPFLAAADRLIGAFEFIGESEYAKRIEGAMISAGHKVHRVNPFQSERPVLNSGARVKSPFPAKVQILWNSMRDVVESEFDLKPRRVVKVERLLDRVRAAHLEDAYHSLSIEGYQVTERLIAKIRDGDWHPDSSTDRGERNAMAAKGYHETFGRVCEVITACLEAKENASKLIVDSVPSWYAALFSASVTSGLVAPTALAGYRNAPVFIRGASHIPPPHSHLMDAMDEFSDCMRREASPVMRAILGHFVFVWIHPYPDGNGRLARFIMNASLVAAGYPWTIIRVENRDRYVAALAAASDNNNIEPFARFVCEEAKRSAAHW